MSAAGCVAARLLKACVYASMLESSFSERPTAVIQINLHQTVSWYNQASEQGDKAPIPPTSELHHGDFLGNNRSDLEYGYRFRVPKDRSPLK